MRRTVNDKSSFSKDLNDKHKKEADNRANFCDHAGSFRPREDSEISFSNYLNLICFISNTGRSSQIAREPRVCRLQKQVRSTTPNTWLPEQVSFKQSMGNEKSNGYWEVELPLDFKRAPVEKFIPEKYVEKRWIPNKVSKSVQESMKGSSLDQCPDDRGATICVSNKAVLCSSGGGEILHTTQQKNNSETHEKLRQVPSSKMDQRRRSSLYNCTNSEVDKVPRVRLQSVDLKNDQFSSLCLAEDMTAFSGYSGWATFESVVETDEDPKFELRKPDSNTLKSTHSNKQCFPSGLDIFKDLSGSMVKEEDSAINSKHTKEDGNDFLKSNLSSSHTSSKADSQVPTTEEKMRSTSASNPQNDFSNVAGHDSRSSDSTIDLTSSSNPKHVPRNGSTEGNQDFTSLAKTCSKTIRGM